MLPILSKMDKVGYWSLEVWGGATFDTCLRFLDENPWERLRIIKQHCPHTPLQMLTRGQNLVGYHHYSKDIVDHFIKASKRNGIDVFRVFDALNDIRNVKDSAEALHVRDADFAIFLLAGDLERRVCAKSVGSRLSVGDRVLVDDHGTWGERASGEQVSHERMHLGRLERVRRIHEHEAVRRPSQEHGARGGIGDDVAPRHRGAREFEAER